MSQTFRPIYYDTETTGTRSEKDRIIELAAFDPVENRTFVYLINPGIPIPPEATAIHKITDEMVADAPSFKEIGALFTDFLPQNSVLIAHNNDAFDKLFLQTEFKRAGLTLPSVEYIDTLKWARKYRPDLPRHTLQSLREIYGIAANQAHRALDDVIILHRVFSCMIDDIPIDIVLKLLARPQMVTRMPFGKHQGKPLADIPKHYVSWLASSGALDKAENQELRQTFEQLGLLIHK
jgi:DNA polymerase-3 subunit epsilon